LIFSFFFLVLYQKKYNLHFDLIESDIYILIIIIANLLQQSEPLRQNIRKGFGLKITQMKNRQIQVLKSAVVLASTIWMSQSCIKDNFEFDKLSKTMDADISVAGAIGQSRLTVEDFVRDYDDDELFEVEADGSLFLMYYKKVYSSRGDQFVSFADQTFPSMTQYDKAAYDASPISGGYRHFPQANIYYNFLLSHQEQLDSVLFDALDIQIQVSSSFEKDGPLTLTFPALVKNGTPYTTTISLDGTGSFNYTQLAHLEDYTLVFNTNRVLVDFDLKLQDGTSQTGDQVNITIAMKNMDYSVIYGYVGQRQIDIPNDTVHLEIFDKAFAGGMYFHEPELTLKMTNYMGLPVRIAFDSLYTYSNIGNQFDGHDYPGQNPLDINRPSTPGQYAITSELFNTTNFPEIRNIMDKSPKYMFFDVSAIINPSGYQMTPPNFLTDSARFDVDMELKLPLYGNAVYSMVDTVGLDIEENFEEISKYFVEAQLRTIFDCFLPANAYGQVIFTDSLYHPLDTLYKDDNIGARFIESAILDANGRAITPVRKITDIIFGNGPQYEHDINDLKHVKHAIVVATYQTNSAGTYGQYAPLVKFYSDNYLDVKFGLVGRARYNEVVH